jgi:hypothetical protein
VTRDAVHVVIAVCSDFDHGQPLTQHGLDPLDIVRVVFVVGGD